ncbi:oligosaccharide flippase family protein [Pleurocapsales cyanobacterium LEGE 10410]|nr:oligosaccharide flippase family protein [Pleurocapsales cyanobacterium LEGE 10410]
MNLSDIKVKITEITKKSLFKDVSWMLIARLINVLVQAAYFVIIARSLGAENYGSFVAVSALASLLFPFVALGSDDVLVQKVSVDRTVFPSHWGNTLLILLINSISITGILLLIAPLIFPERVSLLAVAFLLTADLLCLGLLEAGNKALRAIGLVHKAAQLVVLNTVGKLLAALLLITMINNFIPSANVDINTWSILYFASSLSVGLLALLMTNKIAGKPRVKLGRIRADLAQGIYFSIGMSANNINNNIDKTMLASMATLNATGVYGSAYRFVNIGDVPVLALFNATYHRFFQQGSLGITSCLNFAKKLLPIIIVYGFFSFAAFQVFAPLVPKILGAEYQDAISTLRWLAPLPAINALQLLTANVLTGLGHQKLRSAVQTIAAILNVILNVWLIPIFGLQGAIWATLTSDGMRLICLSIVLLFIYNSRKQT